MADRQEDSATYRIEEQRRTPLDGLIFAWIAMVPFVLAAAGAWVFLGGLRLLAIDSAIIWGGALLTFFSGVRRGLSFRTPQGPTAEQLLMMLWLFMAGIAAIAIPARLPALALLFAGYLSLWLFDPKAARTGEAPLYFARLRPFQMLIPLICLPVVAAALVWVG